MATEDLVVAIAPGKSREERRRVILYWMSTVLLVVLLAAQAILLIRRPPVVTAMVHHLGYPAYFPVLLGTAKLLAVAAIAQPWFGTLKEWAYAGVTFDLIAAAISHLASHDSASDVAGPFVFMALVALSYVAYIRVGRLNTTRPQREFDRSTAASRPPFTSALGAGRR